MKVSVVIPSNASVAAIQRACSSVLEQELGGFGEVLEIIVCHHDTQPRCEELQARLRAELAPRIRVIPNPSGSTPAALNLGIQQSSGDVIARLDTHAVFGRDYLREALAVLSARTDVDIVGGPLRTALSGPLGEAMSWALASRWGVGGSPHHDIAQEGPAESVYMGVFRRQTFERFGLFDDAMRRNQDDEFTYRVTTRGGIVWLCPRMSSTYFRQYTVPLVVKQFFGYGRYKPEVLIRHPRATRARHFLPGFMVLAILAAPVVVRPKRMGLVPLYCYAIVTLTVSRAVGPKVWLKRAMSIWLMHWSYGLGTLVGSRAFLSRFKGVRSRDASRSGADT